MSTEDDDTTVPAEDPTAAKPSRRSLSNAEWEEIIAHYEYGTLSPNEIWKKYDITSSAVSHKFAKLAKKGRLIVKNSKAHLRAAKVAATPAVAAPAEEKSSFEDKRRNRIESTKETLFQQSFLHQKVLLTLQRRIDEQMTAGLKTPSDFDADLKAMKRMADNIALMVETRWKILNIDQDVDEKALPTLVFKDLTEDEIRTMQERSADEDDDGDDMEDFDFDGDAAVAP